MLETRERQPPPLCAGSGPPIAPSLPEPREPPLTRRTSSPLRGPVSHPRVGASTRRDGPPRTGPGAPLRDARCGSVAGRRHPADGRRTGRQVVYRGARQVLPGSPTSVLARSPPQAPGAPRKQAENRPYKTLRERTGAPDKSASQKLLQNGGILVPLSGALCYCLFPLLSASCPCERMLARHRLPNVTVTVTGARFLGHFVARFRKSHDYTRRSQAARNLRRVAAGLAAGVLRRTPYIGTS
jgi:hypothetical protein